MKLILVTMFLFACSNNDKLLKVCPKECYTDRPSTKNVGICHSGRPICDENMNVTSCEGEVTPLSEVCDGLDNDCNGTTDTYGGANTPLMAWTEEENVCGFLGECLFYRASCINGEWTCPYTPQPETCDNKDNDCDGRVDEDLDTQTFCFEDDWWKATNGQCRAGLKGCLDGKLQCKGQVLPSFEFCDEIDNDCNGIVDDTEGTLNNMYDIVFIIDTSGSMCEEINAVANALFEYVDQFQNNSNFRWALVEMSSFTPTLLKLITDFTDINTVQSYINTLGCSGNGNEASIDSMYQVCQRNDGVLGLSWRDQANALAFSFTDEFPQTYTLPSTPIDMVVDSCLEHQVLPFQWSTMPLLFRPMVEPANGIHFNITNDWVSIFDDMNSIVISLCQ